MSDVSIGAVLMTAATHAGIGPEQAAQTIDDGLAAWKAQRLVEFWEHFDGGIQRITAATIEKWPEGADTKGMLEVVDIAKAVLAETAGVLGLPPDFLPFKPEAPE